MNFEFSDDQKLLKEQARGFLASKCTPKDVRRILDGKTTLEEVLRVVCEGLQWLGGGHTEEVQASKSAISQARRACNASSGPLADTPHARILPLATSPASASRTAGAVTTSNGGL